MFRPPRVLACLSFLLGLGSAARSGEGFGFPKYLFAPLRIHLWAGKSEAGLKTTLAPADLERILRQVNRVWAQAGLGFWLESISLEELPAGEGGGSPLTLEVPADLPGGTGWLPRHIDSHNFARDSFNVYYLGRFGVNGICYPRAIFVKDSAQLRSVQGGLDDPIARVTAHELGHALGLPHRQEVFNLMASGTNATALNAEEIDHARLAAIGMTRRFISGPELLRKVQGETADASRWCRVLPLETEALAPLRAALSTPVGQ